MLPRVATPAAQRHHRELGLTLLEARNVSKRFGGLHVLADASFDINAGQFILLRGENGSGKTTLLNMLCGLLAPDAGTIRLYRNGRSVCFDFEQCDRNAGFSLGALARAGVLRSWQGIRLFQSLSLLDNLNVAAPARLGERLTPVLFRRRAVRDCERSVGRASMEILTALGLGALAGDDGIGSSGQARHARNRGGMATGSAVSLGEAKRVAIARACRGDSRLLLLDEPLSGLDAHGIRSVVQLLERLNRERGIAMLVVEHESSVGYLRDLATTTWVLDRGRIAPEQRTESWPRAPTFLGQWKQVLMRRGDSVHTVALPREARITVISPPGGAAEAVGLAVRDLRVMRAGKLVLPPLNFTLPRGAVGILEAPNGWGKTSLAEALAGLLPVAGGEIVVDGVVLQRTEDAWQRRRHGLTLLQSRGLSFPRFKVRETLEVCGVRMPPPFLEGLVDRVVSSLSGGERQRVLLACSQGGHSVRLSIWDEPLFGLDPGGIELFTDIIRERGADHTFLVLLPAVMQDAEGKGVMT